VLQEGMKKPSGFEGVSLVLLRLDLTRFCGVSISHLWALRKNGSSPCVRGRGGEVKKEMKKEAVGMAKQEVIVVRDHRKA
jgi:hypothetical protein